MTSTAPGSPLEQAAAEAAQQIDVVLARVRRHDQSVPATRQIEDILAAVANQARALAPAGTDPDELTEWAERVEFAGLPDGSEGMTLTEWCYEVSDALKPLFNVPSP